MTTIAYCGKYLAVDSQATEGDTRYLGQNKLWKWKHGYFSIAGKITDYPEFEQHLKTGKGNLSKNCVVVFTKDGVVYEQFPGKLPMKAPKKIAWGSGSSFALAAMACGKNAIEAVNIAKKFDINSGGKTRYIEVK